MRKNLMILALLVTSPPALAAEQFAVHTTEVADQKAVIATVEPVHQLVARARIGGTIASLDVKEGDSAAAGAQIAVVADPKLVLEMQGLDSRIQSLQSQRDKAKADFDRAVELQRRGVSTQVQVDAAKTALDVAERTLAAMGSDPAASNWVCVLTPRFWSSATRSNRFSPGRAGIAARRCANERLHLQRQLLSATTAISAPVATVSPSLTLSEAIVPPMRARATS